MLQFSWDWLWRWAGWCASSLADHWAWMVKKRFVLIQHFLEKMRILSQCTTITSNFPPHCPKTVHFPFYRDSVVRACALSIVSIIWMSPTAFKLNFSCARVIRQRGSSWGWNNEIFPLREPGPGAVSAGSREPEQSPLSSGSMPTLGLSVSIKSPLPHSLQCGRLRARLTHLFSVEYVSPKVKICQALSCFL